MDPCCRYCWPQRWPSKLLDNVDAFNRRRARFTAMLREFYECWPRSLVRSLRNVMAEKDPPRGTQPGWAMLLSIWGRLRRLERVRHPGACPSSSVMLTLAWVYRTPAATSSRLLAGLVRGAAAQLPRWFSSRLQMVRARVFMRRLHALDSNDVSGVYWRVALYPLTSQAEAHRQACCSSSIGLLYSHYLGALIFARPWLVSSALSPEVPALVAN